MSEYVTVTKPVEVEVEVNIYEVTLCGEEVYDFSAIVDNDGDITIVLNDFEDILEIIGVDSVRSWLGDKR